MNIIDEVLPNVFLVSIKSSNDIRGNFIKTYNFEEFKKLNLNFIPKESYISSSFFNVVRGMHYQVEKSAHEKLITCIKGKVLDVIVDVRPFSSNFNKPVSFFLSENEPIAILIGKGYAHGFLSLSKISIMSYMTSTVYCPSYDSGVLWSSIDFEWPIKNPILSQRDKLHPLLGNHKCKFS